MIKLMLLQRLKDCLKLSLGKILLVIPLAISSAVVANWTRVGLVISKAEEGLPFYHPSRTYEVYKNLWVENSLGNHSPFILPRLPLLFLFKQAFQLGMEGWLIQAFMFAVLLVVPFIFIPKLIKELIGKDKVFIAYSSSLLYLFNFFTMTQVFHRFVYPLIFCWSLLPAFLYLFIKLVHQFSIKYLAYFVFINLFFSFAYSQPAAVLVLWIPAYLYSFWICLKTKKLKMARKTLMMTLLWLAINIWWLFPLLNLRSEQSILNDPTAAYVTLEEVSRYFPNEEIVFLKQKYYFDNEGYFNILAESKRVIIASRLLMISVLIGVIYSMTKKKYFYLILLLLIGWFVSKGTNPPWGREFYQSLFSNFSFTKVLRNSYEKFGIVFVLPYTVMGSMGMYYGSIELIGRKFGRLLSLAILTFIVITIGRPVYTGEIFFEHLYIKVPDYYHTANNLLNEESSGRILHLPYHESPGAKYSWGYDGEEPSRFLFDRASIAGLTSRLDTFDILLTLPRYFDNPNFTKVLNILNVDSVVIHKDFLKDDFYIYWTDQCIKVVERWENMTKRQEVGELSLYELNLADNLEMIYVVGELIAVENLNEAFKTFLAEDFDPTIQSVLVKEQNNQKNVPLLVSKNLPEIEFKKINPRRYQVKVHQSKEPYWLILANNYNQLWKLAINGQPVNNHVEVNGYANGWLVDKEGNYEIDIIFKIWPWE